MSITVWTVNKEEDIRNMIALGVDCITTNEPELVRSLLGEKELRPAPADGNDPKADPKAVVVAGKARFTVLTSRLIRMEWAENGVFEDRATMGIVNRKTPVPAYTVRRSGKKVTIKTADVTLSYTGDGMFDAKNLSVTFKMPVPGGKKPTAKTVTWKPGADDSGNLGGTARTLDRFDNVTIHKESGQKTVDPMDNGVLSRDGWAIIDESDRHVFVPVASDWKNWVAARDATPRKDLYIFAYGHDYIAALKDFTLVAGKIPLPPKYTLGYWWCRYWQYSDFEFLDLARTFRRMDIPADVMVIDMDWHETWTLSRGKNSVKDEYGQRVGWTGYTWKKELFPNPEQFLKELHLLRMKTTLNLHPASGIQPYEEPYERFVKDYTSSTQDNEGRKDDEKAEGKKDTEPFRLI